MIKNGVYQSIFILSLSLNCCAPNYFSQYYKGFPQDDKKFLPHTGSAQLYSTDNQEKEAEKLIRGGYQPIGYSAFECSECVNEEMLVAQSDSVKADITLYSSKYSGTMQGYQRLTTHTPPTYSTTVSTANGTAEAYGSDGSYASAAGFRQDVRWLIQSISLRHRRHRCPVLEPYLSRNPEYFRSPAMT